MSVTRLSIRSFKCFPQVELPIAPLTILTGFNAAGKSTTLQSLLLIAQGLRCAPRDHYLPLNGPLVRLGTAGDVISRGSREGPVFSFSGFDSFASWRFGAGASFGGEPSNKNNPGISQDMGGGDRERLKLLSTQLDATAHKSSNLLPARYENNPLIKAIQGVIFLGASRGGNSEVYPSPDFADPINGDVGHEGQFAAWWYDKTADNLVPEKHRFAQDPSITVRGQVDAWLGHLFPGAVANAESVRGTSITKLNFKLGQTGWSRPANVGYGLNYAFPLVVTLIVAKEGQLIIVDSPEAHLHPRAQSRIGQMLAHFAASGIQILVETHSDHVLSGVRLSVRAGTISPDQVAIHFFSGESSVEQTGIVSPSIDKLGALSAWPDGFFDQAEHDLLLLAGNK